MARSHGKILVDIWLDPDFVSLDTEAQWTYMALLSQPGLTMVGAIDFRPNRWAQLAAGLTPDRVDAAVQRLEAARFVCVDRTTEELLIRTMTRHDGLRANNRKLLKGLWSSWKAIASVRLRKVAVDHMPDHLFGTEATPPAAEQMRAVPPIACPIDWASDWAIERATDRTSDRASDRRIGPPSTIHLPTSTVSRPGARSVHVVLDPPEVPKIPEKTRAVAAQALTDIRESRRWPKVNPAAGMA